MQNRSDATEPVLDVVVIGAGPVGLACAIEARHAGLTARVLDKGALVNSIVGYPARMEFFSTPDLIEIGGHPFPVQGYKPTREEGLEYYRGVAAREGVDVRLYERVEAVRGEQGAFRVETSRGVHECRHVVVATGFFDIPNRLGVPGEQLGKVTHFYREPYPYVQQRVAVVGARNSAAKAALDCYRHGAQVTMIVRGPALSDSIKYWIRPDLENRLKEGSIRAYFESTVEEIREDLVLVRTPTGIVELGNDFVLAMTGYQPDFSFLASLGLTFADDGYSTPIYRREDVRVGAAGRVRGRHGVRRDEDQSLVHRERPLSRPPDHAAPRRTAHRDHSVCLHPLEDRGVGARGLLGQPKGTTVPCTSMIRIPSVRVLSLAAGVMLGAGAATAQPTDAAVPRLELRPHDRVVLVGNTLADRQQYFNHFETTLLALYPQLELSLRNLARSADTLTLQPRPLNFGDDTTHLTAQGTDVMLAFFGANESFEGEAGVPQFEKDLEAYIARHQAARYNGEAAPRLAFVSPIAHEKLDRLVHVDVDRRNRELERYTSAMRRVTTRLGVPFADVFTPMREAMGSAKAPLTINGMHLNEDGDKVFAVVLLTALGLAPEELPSGSKSYADLRALINEKNRLFFLRFRPAERRIHRRAPPRSVRVGQLPPGDAAARRIGRGAGEEDLEAGANGDAAPGQADPPQRFGRVS